MFTRVGCRISWTKPLNGNCRHFVKYSNIVSPRDLVQTDGRTTSDAVFIIPTKIYGTDSGWDELSHILLSLLISHFIKPTDSKELTHDRLSQTLNVKCLSIQLNDVKLHNQALVQMITSSDRKVLNSLKRVLWFLPLCTGTWRESNMI